MMILGITSETIILSLMNELRSNNIKITLKIMILEIISMEIMLLRIITIQILQ